MAEMDKDALRNLTAFFQTDSGDIRELPSGIRFTLCGGLYEHFSESSDCGPQHEIPFYREKVLRLAAQLPAV
jgi:hypothetical protein